MITGCEYVRKPGPLHRLNLLHQADTCGIPGSWSGVPRVDRRCCRRDLWSPCNLDALTLGVRLALEQLIHLQIVWNSICLEYEQSFRSRSFLVANRGHPAGVAATGEPRLPAWPAEGASTSLRRALLVDGKQLAAVCRIKPLCRLRCCALAVCGFREGGREATDPDLTLSRHPARATARRLPPSIDYRVPPVAG
jgi:hypothetical protein